MCSAYDPVHARRPHPNNELIQKLEALHETDPEGAKEMARRALARRPEYRRKTTVSGSDEDIGGNLVMGDMLGSGLPGGFDSDFRTPL